VRVALQEAEKKLLLATFDMIERESPRLSLRVQNFVIRAKELVASQTRRGPVPYAVAQQLALPFPPRRPRTIKRKGRRRYAQYDAFMVEDARKMRANGYGYREISEALNKENGTSISWRTVADWCTGATRILG
jgi:hypothetical protein